MLYVYLKIEWAKHSSVLSDPRMHKKYHKTITRCSELPLLMSRLGMEVTETRSNVKAVQRLPSKEGVLLGEGLALSMI